MYKTFLKLYLVLLDHNLRDDKSTRVSEKKSPVFILTCFNLSSFKDFNLVGVATRVIN
jgi:hypothetical protein